MPGVTAALGSSTAPRRDRTGVGTPAGVAAGRVDGCAYACGTGSSSGGGAAAAAAAAAQTQNPRPARRWPGLSARLPGKGARRMKMTKE